MAAAFALPTLSHPQKIAKLLPSYRASREPDLVRIIWNVVVGKNLVVLMVHPQKTKVLPVLVRTEPIASVDASGQDHPFDLSE